MRRPISVFSVDEASAKVGAVSTGARVPSWGLVPLCPLPRGEDGASLWSSHIQFLKPGECACGPAGRGTEWGLGPKRGGQRSGCSGAGFWAEGAPQPGGAPPGPPPGPRRGASQGRAGKPGQGQLAAAGPARRGRRSRGRGMWGVSSARDPGGRGGGVVGRGASARAPVGWGAEDAGSGRRGTGRPSGNGRAGRSGAAPGGVLGGGARIGGRGAAPAPGVGERVGRLRRIRFSRRR